MVDDTRKLGRVIAQGTNSTDDVRQEIVPDDTNQNLLLAPYDRVRVRVKASFTKKYYAEDSFILDHPVYGELDSSTLKLDGGYDSSSEEIVYTYYDNE